MKLSEIKNKFDLVEMCHGYNTGWHLQAVVSWETGEVCFDAYHESSKNTQSFREFHGHESTFHLPKVDARDIKRVFDKFSNDIKEVSKYYVSEWNGSNHVAEFPDLPERLEDLELNIQNEIENLIHSDPADYYDPREYIEPMGSKNFAIEIGLTAKTSDDDLAEMAKNLAEDTDFDILLDPDDCENTLLKLRDQLAADEND